MADLESTAAPEVRAKAESMGWIPPERFSGDPERFVDADEYVKRGEEVLPIIRARNKTLEETTKQQAARIEAQERAIEEMRESVAALEEHHTKATKAQVEAARSQLLAELRAAREAGDLDAEIRITDELTQAPPPPPKKEAPKVETPPLDPAVKRFMDENPWYTSTAPEDVERQIDFNSTAQKLRARGNRSVGQEFIDAVLTEFEKSKPRGMSKAEGGSPSRSAASGGKSFADLPAEAKAECHKDNKKLVGPNRRFKTQGEWESYYANLYFAQEA